MKLEEVFEVFENEQEAVNSLLSRPRSTALRYFETRATTGEGALWAREEQVSEDFAAALPTLTVAITGRGNFSEWREDGRRRRQPAGNTAAQAMEEQRRKRHELEAHTLGLAPRNGISEVVPVAELPSEMMRSASSSARLRRGCQMD